MPLPLPVHVLTPLLLLLLPMHLTASPPPLLLQRPIGPLAWRAVSFTLPEDDPVCGPGAYRLEELLLPLSLNESLPGGVLSLTALLYPTDAATGCVQCGGGWRPEGVNLTAATLCYYRSKT